MNTAPALGTVWWDSSKQGCRNARDFLLMVPLGTPLSSFKVSQLCWRERLTCSQAKLSLPRSSSCPLVSEGSEDYPTAHFLLDGYSVILPRPGAVQTLHPAALCRLRPTASFKPEGVEAMIRFSESLISHWSHLKSSSSFSHLFNSLPLNTLNHSTGILYLEGVRGA